MICPTCGKASEVIDSRVTATGVRRRRRCLNEHRFSTVEMTADRAARITMIDTIRRMLGDV